MLHAFDGNKTYLVAFGVVVVGVLKAFGWIDEATANLAFTTLTGAAVGTFRSAMKSR